MEQVDRGGKLLVLTDGHMQGNDAGAVGLAKLPQDLIEIGVFAIQPPDDDDPWGLVLFELGPDRLGPDLHAGRCVDEHDGRVRDPQRGVLIAREVRVAGSVEEVDLDAVGGERRDRHVDRDVTLLLFRIRIQDARAVVDLPESVRRSDRMEEGFDEARLSRSTMADDGHVSDLRGLR